jgi:hypothetical protein
MDPLLLILTDLRESKAESSKEFLGLAPTRWGTKLVDLLGKYK